MKCYSGVVYVFGGASLGLGWYLTDHMIFYPNQPVPLWLDVLTILGSGLIVAKGVHQLATGKSCKTRKQFMKRRSRY